MDKKTKIENVLSIKNISFTTQVRSIIKCNKANIKIKYDLCFCVNEYLMKTEITH